MPFYLVTQITLIEAEDENAAAQKSVDQIRSGKQVTVTVKCDKVSLSHIVVAARPVDGSNSEAARHGSNKRDHAVLPIPMLVPKTERQTTLKRFLKNACNLVKRRL